MGYGLLGAHSNTTVGGVPELISRWKPPIVVILDHSDVWRDVKEASPETLFVGRIFQPVEPNFNDPDLDPLEAARDHCDKILRWAERGAEIYDFWQGVNEPIINSAEAMQRCADFDAERALIMDEHGFRVVVGSFSVGNPELYLWNEFLPALEAAQQYNGALALHEYAWPTLKRQWPWYLLRHRKVYDGEPDHNWEGLPAHLKTLPLLITECGLDGLIELGHPPRGWRVLYGEDPEKYLRQLAWYDAELHKDPYVAGAAIYCCGVADSTWSSYDIWPEVAVALARRAEPLYRLADWQPTEPFEPVEPTEPFEPFEPFEPVEPSEPVQPSEQIEPTEPAQPLPPPRTGWQMETEYRSGSRIIAGSFPRAGIELTITDPWGNSSTVVSGSKADYGEGGFEVLAPHSATYTLTFLEETFEVQTQDQAVILTFGEVELPQPPSSPAEDTTEEPFTPESPIDEIIEEPFEPETPIGEIIEEPFEPETPIDEIVEEPFEPDTPIDEIIEEPSEPDTPIGEIFEDPFEPEIPIDEIIEDPFEPEIPEDETIEVPQEPAVSTEETSNATAEPLDEDSMLDELAKRLERIKDALERLS